MDTTSCSLSHEGPTALDGMGIDEIAAFRRNKVEEYAFLGIFPADYDPLHGPGARIWKSISPGANWLGPSVYYVANPYLPIVLTCANHVTPLALFCPQGEVVYEGGRIVESHRGEDARCWSARVWDPAYADHPGQVRAVMVNAYDAGFPFAHVDISASQNIARDDSSDHITRGLHSQSSFFHLGRYTVNNISPEDHRAWLRLLERGAATRVVIRLWRQIPPSPAQEADLTYELDVGPEA